MDERQGVQKDGDNRMIGYNDVVDVISKRVRSNYDCQVVISGGTGDGKSNLAIQLAMRLQSDFVSNMQSQIIFKRQEAIDSIKRLEPFKVMIIDESMNLLFRRDFMKSQQKETLKLLDMCRKKNLVVLWNVPSFFSLDSHFVDTRVLIWLYVYERGKAHIYLPLKGETYAFISDPWVRGLNCNKFLGRKYRRSPNFAGTFEFQQLPKDIEDKYLAIAAVKSEGSEVDDPKLVLDISQYVRKEPSKELVLDTGGQKWEF